MTSYDFDYAILLLRQAIDFAEIEHDFVPLRKWVNEVEQSGHEMGAVDGRLNLPAGHHHSGLAPTIRADSAHANTTITGVPSLGHSTLRGASLHRWGAGGMSSMRSNQLS